MYHPDFPCLNTNNTMKYTHISMTGNLTVDYDTRNCLKRGELVVAGLHNKSAGCRYAVSNNEIELQNMLNSPNLKDVTLVTSLKLYKKYMFFDNVDYLPSFPENATLDIDVDNCSPQLLALLLSCWCEYSEVYCFGYDIEDLRERELFIKVAESNPTIKIYYVRKPNVNKIKIFDHLKNVKIIDFKEYTEYAKSKK